MLKPSIAAAVASLCALSGCATTPVTAPATDVHDFPVAGAASVQVRFASEGDTVRTYTHSSTMPTREQAPSTIRYAEVAGQPFLMRVDPTLTVTQDEKIRVSINSQDVHVFDASSEKRL